MPAWYRRGRCSGSVAAPQARRSFDVHPDTGKTLTGVHDLMDASYQLHESSTTDSDVYAYYRSYGLVP